MILGGKLVKKVKKVIKPFAGLGTRILTDTKKVPKEMPPLNESLIVYTRENLWGLTAVNVVSFGYKASTFKIVSSCPLFVNWLMLNYVNKIRTKL